MDIVDQLQQQIHIESVGVSPRTSPAIEVMKRAQEEIQKLRVTQVAAMTRILARMHPESKDADDLRRLIKEAEGRDG